MATATLTNLNNPFSGLRETGLELLQQRIGAVWTDHNLHDPGITILESLCYVFTELILKSGLDIPTLMGSINKDPAWPDLHGKDTLFNSPLTETDYRKLLLGHKYARNAWLTPLSCPDPVYYDSTTHTLRLDNPFGLAIPFYIKGLNNVLFELEDAVADASLPDTDIDLNRNVISRTGPITPPGESAIFEIAFPFWDEAPALCSDGLPLGPVTATVSSTAIPASYLVTLKFDLTTGGGPVTVTIGVYVDVLPTGAVPLTSTPVQQEAAVKILLENIAAGAPVPVFLEKMKRTRTSVDDLILFMQQYRNLDEDVAAYKIVRIQEVAMEADLLLSSDVAPEFILAQIYRKLDKWFEPAIPFHTAEELAGKGWPVENIYEGPKLGDDKFVDEADFPMTDQATSIHVSDLVNVFMGTDGVEALEDFGITNYVNNVAVTSHEHNCLVLISPSLYKARFSQGKSVLRVFQDGILRNPDPVLIKTYMDQLAAEEDIPVAPVITPTPPALPDRSSEISTYYSLQNEFPAVYALKEGELAADADALRTAQRLQLKAYLSLFEQLLANYTSQLGSFRNIFSIDPSITTTYPSQPLYNVPDIAMVLDAFVTGSYVDWEDFITQPANPYATAVATTETAAGFTSRRQLFLDHLLGVLGHTPDDFTIRRFDGSANPDDLIIAQKCRFLRDFPVLSSQRGKAFCYRETATIKIWDTDNVSGLEKRLAHLLDIDPFLRQNLGTTKEGFFLIEHLLLRPQAFEPSPIPFLLPEASYDLPDTLSAWQMDPYSFRVTVVFPGFKGRFGLDEFRRRAERILAIETPAYIVPEAYWITDATEETNFETAMHNWLTLQGQVMPTENPARATYITNWSAAKAGVIKHLNHFRKSKYSTDVIPLELTPPYIVNTPA